MATLNPGPTAHTDTFTRDNLPPADQWPDLATDRPEFQYPDYLNAAVELTDRNVERGFGDRGKAARAHRRPRGFRDRRRR